MSLVCWESWMGNREVIAFNCEHELNYQWKDPITNTEFAVKSAFVRETAERGWNLLYEKYLKGKERSIANDILYKYFTDAEKFLKQGPSLTQGEYLTLRVFGELPFLVDGQVKARFSDLAILGTGITYALLYKELNFSEDTSWQNYRWELLLAPLKLQYPEVIDAPLNLLASIYSEYSEFIKIVLSHNPQEEACAELCLDLLKGSSVKLKSYIFENSKIQDIRGASTLLDDLNRFRVPKWFSDQYTPECMVYCGGGNVLAVLPQGEGSRAAKELEVLYEQVTLTAQTIFVSLPVSTKDLCLNFGRTMAFIEDEKTRRQLSKINFINDDFTLHNPGTENFNRYDTEAMSLKNAKDFEPNAGLRCDHCGIRRPTYIVTSPKDEEKLCASCYYKLSAGTEGKQILRGEFESYVRGVYDYPYGVDYLGTRLKLVPSKKIVNLEDIANESRDQRHIAVIYGDGNNMGTLVQNLKSFAESRLFSERTEKAAYRCTFQAVSEILGTHSVEFIALGGDDIFLITPGDTAFALATRLGRYFDNEFRNLSTGEASITMSIGLVIAKYNTPVRQLFEISASLLKSAKKKAKELNKLKGLHTKVDASGTIDVGVLESFSNFSDSPQNYREETFNFGDRVATCMPVNWEQGEALAECIELFKSKGLGLGKNKIYAFREMSLHKSEEEANLFFYYTLTQNLLNKGSSKEKKEQLVKALGRLEKALGGQEFLPSLY